MKAAAVLAGLSLRQIGGIALFAVGSLALTALSVQGFGNALRNTSDLVSPAQYLMTGAQFAYSALGLLVIVLAFVRPGWFRAAWMAWAFFFVTAIALIPWAWIEPSIRTTLEFAAAGLGLAVLICFLVVFGSRSLPTRGAASKETA